MTWAKTEDTSTGETLDLVIVGLRASMMEATTSVPSAADESVQLAASELVQLTAALVANQYIWNAPSTTMSSLTSTQSIII